MQIEQVFVKPESLQAPSNKQEQLQSISSKLVEQLATKQQEFQALTAKLNETRDRSNKKAK